MSATELGRVAASEAIERAGVFPEQVNEVIFGQVLTAGTGQAPARQVQLGANIPPEAGALTINKVCGSGLKAVILGAQAILLGDHDCVLVGGMESMSQSPYLLPNARQGFRFGGEDLVDSMIHDGLWDPHNDFHMGQSAEKLAREYNISREEQDQFALESHRKALEAWDRGYFEREVVPVTVDDRGEKRTIDRDERPRSDTSLESLGDLEPAFDPDGTVTAGNASGISDGASALVLASSSFLQEQESMDRSLACLNGYATGGVEPEWVMRAPLQAIEALHRKTGDSMKGYDIIEINEAFAAQGCHLLDQMEIPDDRFNVHGGAVALGHPIGCTGARILTTLVHALHVHEEKNGLASLCLGGGNGVSVSIEAINL